MAAAAARRHVAAAAVGVARGLMADAPAAPASLHRLHSLVHALGGQPVTPVRLIDLLRTGVEARQSTAAVVRNAQLLQRELPVRLARRCRAFEALPFIVGLNPRIHQVYALYVDSLRHLHAFRRIESPADEHDFSAMLTDLVAAHADVIPTVSQGFLECRQHMPVTAIGAFLDDLITARIGVRVLAEHHLAIRAPNHHHAPHTVGIISRFRPSAMARSLYDTTVSDLALSHYGAVPPLTVDGLDDPELTYIAMHLEYILQELLKNAVRATVEHHHRGELPPIDVTIGTAQDEVVMRIRDRGGGVPYSDLPHVFEYSFTTVDSTTSSNDALGNTAEMMMQAGVGGPIAGLGYGLGTARVYARYFGGSLRMISLDGHGCDVFLRLKNINMDREDIHI